MADEIEIEEHDVLENPQIKRIFPDLSILKKEINDYDDYDGCDESSQSSNAEDLRRKQAKPIRNEKNQQKDVIASNEKSIISGTKTTVISNKKQKLEVYFSKPKICLQNISQSLNSNPYFCKMCSIVFASGESFDQHQLLIHQEAVDETLNENCDGTITNVGNTSNIKKDIDSIHEKYKDNQMITGPNVMVKISDSNLDSLPESNLKECFHCDMMFKTQQSLIDHLYDVLISRKTQNLQTKPVNQDEKKRERDEKKDDQQKIIEKKVDLEQNRNSSEITEDVKIYRCPICMYCFKEWEFYKAHMIKKHDISKVKWTNMVSFEPNCKFCNIQYSNFRSYNTHLHKRHKNKILLKVKKQSFNNINKGITAKKTIFDLKRHQVGLINNKLRLDNIKRSIVPEQLKCIKTEVKIVVHKTILFKCSLCNIHFLTSNSATNHTEHSVLEDSECTLCGRVFKIKDINLHLEQHKYSNYITINTCKAKDDTKDIFERTNHRKLHKCPTCSVHFSEEATVDHSPDCGMGPSQSVYCKNCDIHISDDIKTSHDREHENTSLKLSNIEIVDSKIAKRRNFKKGYKREKLGNRVPKYLFHLIQCKVCDCNALKAHYKSAIHYRSRCAHMIKYVCKYCGLVFSNKSINSHRKLHHKINGLTIRDFTFYDLKTGKKILPSLPVFPKCNSCHKHFISKFEVKRHVCNGYNHLTCPVCDIKLSQTAFDLHMPFHDLILNNDGIKQNPTVEEIEPSVIRILRKNKINAIFSCNNCIVAFNSYDEAIEHCHMHTDLDAILIDSVNCKICDLQFDKKCYEEHEKLHEDFPEEKYIYFIMDVFHCGSSNDKWLKHVFGSTSQEIVDEILKKSIYRYEARVNMRILQDGSSDVTVYKCEKCGCYIETSSIYEHCKFCEQNDSEPKEETICDNSTDRIVAFNGQEDKDLNDRIAKMNKCYVLYQCRVCHVVVNRKYEDHICAVGVIRDCGTCGLLLNEDDYDNHIEKHKRLNSFNGNFMKVILLGAKPEQKSQKSKNQMSKFSGIVCDYTFYKCSNCDVCVRDYRSTFQHYCLIDAAKAKCIICDLVFDEGKLKGHLKLHDTDPYFVKDTMLILSFDNKINTKTHVNAIEKNEVGVSDESVTNTEESDSKSDLERKINIYKCKCGLHYLSEETALIHMKKCKGTIKVKQSKQNCFKCNLQFSPDVLFKHLIEHHGNKNITFKYEIVEAGINPFRALNENDKESSNGNI